MNLIETKPVGDANFYKFSVDFTGDDFILGGKTLPLGIITHDILNIPADKLLYIFKTGDKLNDLYNRLNAENYSDELFTSIRKTVEKILDIIGKIKPFSYFNISEECEHIDLLLSDDKIKMWQRSFSSMPIPNINFVPEGTAMHDHIIVLTEFTKSYIYLCADTFNFYKVAMMYFVNLTENGFRDKVLLAGFTKEFFGKEEVAEWIDELNATEITHNFTLEPGVWMAPVVLENKDGSAVLGRRIGRSRGIQQLRAAFQHQVVALFGAVSPCKIKMPLIHVPRKGLHARRAVGGGKQTGDPIRCCRIQHDEHLFPRAGTVVHTIDEMRVIIRKAAHFFSAACLCL